MFSTPYSQHYVPVQPVVQPGVAYNTTAYVQPQPMMVQQPYPTYQPSYGSGGYGGFGAGFCLGNALSHQRGHHHHHYNHHGHYGHGHGHYHHC